MGPHIQKLFKNDKSDNLQQGNEDKAWGACRLVSLKFLRSIKAEICKELIENMVYHKLGRIISLKLHFLHSHLDFFPDNRGVVNDENRDRFCQDITTLEKRYQSKWPTPTLAEYCWALTRDNPEQLYKQQAKKHRSGQLTAHSRL